MITALFRRLVLAPVVIALTTLMWTAIPFWLIGTGVAASFVPRWLRPVRLIWVMVLHLTLESIILVELFGLWIASGFGLWIRRHWFERVHYDIVQAYLVVFFRESRRVLRLKVETIGPSPAAFPGEPLLVCCRHAGPGDSFLLMYALMHWYGREPRVVLKDTLAWDPAVGILLHRLPSRFVRPNPGVGEDVESQIADLARNLDENDAFVIFPEGGNFTPKRRARAITRLRRLGMERMARRAERMKHVLAPKPGGLLAALAAAPEADVLLVAHTGMDHVLTLRDVWHSLPMDKQISMGWWRVPRAEIPTGRDDQIEWLFDWWELIDDWVEEHRPTDLPPAQFSRTRQQA
jgi:1-acyl-sn-glycerol-3-phosphate acyltransferase